jgi:amidase
LNPDAFSIAQKLDAERAKGKVRGPLHGIPFIVKDNIASKDRMETTAGSWALLGSVVPRDSHVVHGLRKAGALLLGKGALSEWADMRSNNYSEGFTARGGQCRSAYNFTVNPGGSSTGPGVAVGANLVPIALGTETDGSVINPSQRNAIVGIKPTVGLTSRAGVIPESLHQDTVGTFARTVRDAVYALDAIYGVDTRDNYTLAQKGLTPKGGYTQFLSRKDALKGAVFGLPWASFWALNSAEQNADLLELIELIKSAGATIINGTELPHYKTIVSPDGWNWDYGSTRGFANESEYSYIKVDFYNNLRDYLSEVNNTNVRTVEDLVQYNTDNYGSEGGLPGIHPAFGSGQDGLIASMESKGIMNETYFQALEFCQRTTREEGIDAALNFNGTKLDGLLVPPDVAQSIQIAAQAGYPVITVPGGVDSVSGMPFGLAIMNTAFSEPTLIKYASAIEDLKNASGPKWKRALPEWRGYLERNLPVIM